MSLLLHGLLLSRRELKQYFVKVFLNSIKSLYGKTNLKLYLLLFLFTLGCLVTPNNVEEVIKSIVYRLDELEKRSFEVSADVNNVMSNMRAEAERLTYGLFEEETSVSRSVSMLPSVATSTADSGFIAMIRTGKISRHKLSISYHFFQLLAVFSRFSAREG